MNVTRITLLGVLFVPLICFGKREQDSCGTYPERVKEELFRAKQNLEHRQLEQVFRKLSGLAAIETPRGASRDVGNIVVMEEDAGIISRRNPFTLNAKRLRFVPVTGGYRVEVGDSDYSAAEQSQGEPITDLGDDDTRRFDMPFAFPFFGQQQRALFVNSDGNVTFEEADGTSRERSLGRLLSGAPRLAAFFDDLDPARGGTVSVLRRQDRVVVTWDSVPEYVDLGVGARNTFQIRMLATGVIELVYRQMGSEIGVVGIAPGRLSLPSSIIALATPGDTTYSGAIAERFTNREELDTVSAAQRFYENHDDSYDYLVFYNAMNISAGLGVVAFEVTVRNQRTGYGDALVESGTEYGSARRLQAVLNMGPIAQYPVDPSGILPSRFTSRDTPITVLGHEAGHLFLAFASVRDAAGGRPMLGRQTAHWNFAFNSEASLLEGNRILDKGAGASPRFETVAVTEGYSPLDQYLMGFRGKDEVGPLFYVANAGFNQFFPPPPQVGVQFNGTRRDVVVDDLVAEYGPRVPDHTVSQRKFRFGFVMIVPKGSTGDPALLAQLESYRSGFESYYFRAAGQRASAEATLKQSVRVSLWPASGVLAGQSATGSIELARTQTTARTFALQARNAMVSVPATVTVPAGEKRVEFAVRGTRGGVDVLDVTPADAAYESVEARVQVVDSAQNLLLEVVSGAGQLAGSGFLADAIVLKVVDGNRLPFPGTRVTADAGSGGAVEPASAVADENGLVRFRWRPAAIPANRLVLQVAGGPSTIVTAQGRPYLLTSTVVNGASFVAGITPLAIQTIFGVNLSAGAIASATVPWPGRINGVEVLVNGRPQPLIYISEGQINFYVADEFAGLSDVGVKVVTPLGESEEVRVPLRRVAPGIFPGAVVRRGEFLEAYGTGLGPVALRDGLMWATNPTEATVNGVNATVTFAGLTPGYVGLYQVNLRVPAGVTGALRVKVKTGSVESNEVVAP